MVKEELKEARQNIAQRLTFLSGEMQRHRARYEEANSKMDEIRPELLQAQERQVAIQEQQRQEYERELRALEID